MASAAMGRPTDERAGRAARRAGADEPCRAERRTLECKM